MKKVYHDLEGNERTIWQMVRAAPEWAANRIQQGERAAEQIERLEAERRELVDALRIIHSFAYGDDAHDMDPEGLLERIRIESYKCIANIDAQRGEGG